MRDEERTVLYPDFFIAPSVSLVYNLKHFESLNFELGESMEVSLNGCSLGTFDSTKISNFIRILNKFVNDELKKEEEDNK